MAVPPGGQQRLDSGLLVAAARANLDELELQDNRGSKRGATARTPSPNSDIVHPNPSSQLRLPPAAVKKSRGEAACRAARTFVSPGR